MKRISFLPNKYKRAEQHFCNEDKNKVHSQIKMHLENITKIKKHKKHLQYKVSKNKHTTSKESYNLSDQDNQHLNSINKISKYRKLNMAEHKTDMNITKIQKIKYGSTQNRQEYYHN